MHGIFLGFFLIFSPLSQAEELIPSGRQILLDSLVKDPSASQQQSDERYNASGAYDSFISSSCHYDVLKRNIQSLALPTKELAQYVQKWVNVCQAELSRGHQSALGALLNFSQVRYPLKQNPRIQSMDFYYDEGRFKIRSLVAFKDQKKRPLVIIRNGLNGDASEETSVKNFMMHLSDESPFHVIFLGNLTGNDFMHDNKVVSMGGFDEGRQYHEIIKQLTDQSSPYHHLIEDIHVMGISLGGNGALMSSVYNRYQEDGLGKVKSVLAICPVVNLQNSYERIFSQTIIGAVGFAATNILVKKFYEEIPLLQMFFKKKKIWSQEELYQGIKNSTVEHYKNRTAKNGWDYLPFYGQRVQSEKDFWNLNDITKFVAHIQTPTLVLYAEDDPIVESSQNADLLFKNSMNQNPYLGGVEFENGSHCALNVANGWPTISTLVREFVLKHSTYVSSQEGVLPLKYKVPPQEISTRKLAKYEWSVERGSSSALLKLNYFDPAAFDNFRKESCRFSDYRFANKKFCYRRRNFSIPLQILSKWGARVPSSNYEANAMTRWLNTHVIPKGTGERLIYGTSEVPSLLAVDQMF